MRKSSFQKHILHISSEKRLVYWKRSGKNQTIILLHGFSGDHEGLLELAEQLPSELEIIVPDLPGFGLSDDPAEASQHSILEYAECLKDIIQTLVSTNEVILIGHSFGCMVAFTYAAQHPGKIAAVVGINPITTRKVLPRLLGTIGTAAFRRFGFERSKRLMAWPPLVDFETYYLVRHISKERYELVKKHRRHEAAMFRNSTFTMLSAADNFRRDTYNLQLTCPALYIVASDDNVAGKTDSKWFLNRSPGAILNYCYGGHLAPVVFPSEIATIILDANILITSKERV